MEIKKGKTVTINIPKTNRNIQIKKLSNAGFIFITTGSIFKSLWCTLLINTKGITRSK